ncbi:MAG: ABC transporter permease, partial [bacterium]
KSEEEGPPISAFGVVITSLKQEDAEAIKKQIPEIEAASGVVRAMGSVKWDSQSTDTTFLGVDSPDYWNAENLEAENGRVFSEEESVGASRVVVLGSEVKKNLFGQENPIGKTVKIKKENFLVVGVLKEYGTVGFQNRDNQLFVPLKSAQTLLLGINYLNLIAIKFKDGADIDKITKQVEIVLRDRHKIENPIDDDFTVRSSQQALETLTSVTDALKFFLAGIAAISLVVGGIGIMNIMLISVVERTREIGLRKAVGATNGNILLQFLAETIIISVSGGVAGSIFGIGVTFLIALVANWKGFNWDFIISPLSIILAVSVSLIVGLIFGLWPAYQAAKKDPIDALRYE